jgi:hypothetical protein
MTDVDEVAEALQRVSVAFTACGIRWAVGGSLASTAYGEPRATNDIDIVALLTLALIPQFISELGSSFYADADMAKEAVTRRSCFNIVDNLSLTKIDIFIPERGSMGEGQLLRVKNLSLFASTAPIPVLAAEDTILQKLRWYKLGNEVSDRQWRDILSVLRSVGPVLDMGYVTDVAQENDLAVLLNRAIADSKAS